MFHALGEKRIFPSPGFWADPRNGLHFLFHLHGFGDLAAYAAERPTPEGDSFWSAVLQSWLEECERPAMPAWHPFPTSGRLISWCAALSRGGWHDALEGRMTVSLRRQLRFLRRSVEYDIGGNHVLRNAAALAVAGVCLAEHSAETRGLGLLEREVDAQVLADGGHEERSPSYHRAVLADLDDVATLLTRLDRPVPEWLDRASSKMREWLRALAGPDGRLPLLNDGWCGPPLTGCPDRNMSDLAASGYIVLRHNEDQAVLDVGPVAPPHLPAHAHADALSFVLWGDGAPIVVDPGSFTYRGPERRRFRGTAAHSTVKVDGRDQCDLWGPFRAAHMPKVRRLRLERVDDITVVAAQHDGYRILADPVVHRRTFCWIPGDGMVVLDRLIADTDHDAQSRLPLAPGITPADQRLGPFTVSVLGDVPDPVVESGRYAPFFGTALEAVALCIACRVSPGSVFGWALLRNGTTASLERNQVRIRRAREGTVAIEVL